MSNTAAHDAKLNEMILTGKAMEGFELYYADDVKMQENTDPPFVGKDFNRKRETEFFSTIEQFHDGKLVSSAVNGDVTFSEWDMDITLKGVGRISMTQAVVRHWKHGKIVFERFYHK